MEGNKFEKQNYDDMKSADEVAIWKKASKNGGVYFSGLVTVGGETIRIVAFPNKHKEEGDNKPILVFKKKQEEGAYKQPVQNSEEIATPAEAKSADTQSASEIKIEDIPFN